MIGFPAIDAQPAPFGHDLGVLLAGVVVAVFDLAAAATAFVRRSALRDPARQRNVHGRALEHPLPEEPGNGVVCVAVQLQHGDVGPVGSVAEPVLVQIRIDDVENLNIRIHPCEVGFRGKRLACSSSTSLTMGLLQ